ncbi:hypothetical protein H4219_003171 [Mycoemilia scoparia]|uniref:chitin synthase n=1 Tax=Mycoemilia scoparia TaxID=417184 RepID=A0A9W7ZVL0_9FUNG|nr:hypothetical protein H4219_003171 [Mycoemilia scoparia]
MGDFFIDKEFDHGEESFLKSMGLDKGQTPNQSSNPYNDQSQRDRSDPEKVQQPSKDPSGSVEVSINDKQQTCFSISRHLEVDNEEREEDEKPASSFAESEEVQLEPAQPSPEPSKVEEMLYNFPFGVSELDSDISDVSISGAIAKCFESKQPYFRIRTSNLIACFSTEMLCNTKLYSITARREYVDKCCRNFEDKKQTRDGLLPHINELVTDAYTHLRSGLAGSGKTTTFNHIMSQIRMLTLNSSKGPSRSQTQLSHLPVIQSTLLEAFTFGSISSSRAGNWIEFHFDQSGQLTGAKLLVFSLDRFRVTDRGSGEANFNIFYDIARGASNAELQYLKLGRSIDKWTYLRYTNPTKQLLEAPSESKGKIAQKGPLLREREAFVQFQNALEVCGIKASVQDKIFRIFAAILHLGNVEFEDMATQGGAATVKDTESFLQAARLLGISTQGLESVLVQRMAWVGPDLCMVLLNSWGARRQRDLLSRCLYHLIVYWIIDHINQQLAHSKGNCVNHISVLDMYGFQRPYLKAETKAFTSKPPKGQQQSMLASFSYLCTSAANEFLQSHITGINIDNKSGILRDLEKDMVYPPNSGTTQFQQTILSSTLVCGSPLDDMYDYSLIATMEKYTLIHAEDAKDARLLENIYRQHSRHDKFVISKKGPTKHKSDWGYGSFGINHYAGHIAYSIDNMADFNGESAGLPPDFTTLFHNNCQDKFVRKLWHTSSLSPSKIQPKRFSSAKDEFSSILQLSIHNRPSLHPTVRNKADSPIPLDPSKTTKRGRRAVYEKHEEKVVEDVCYKPFNTGYSEDITYYADHTGIPKTEPLSHLGEISNTMQQLLKAAENTKMWFIHHICPADPLTASASVTKPDIEFITHQVEAFGISKICKKFQPFEYTVFYKFADFIDRYYRTYKPAIENTDNSSNGSDGSGGGKETFYDINPLPRLNHIFDTNSWVEGVDYKMGRYGVYLVESAWRSLEVAYHCHMQRVLPTRKSVNGKLKSLKLSNKKPSNNDRSNGDSKNRDLNRDDSNSSSGSVEVSVKHRTSKNEKDSGHDDDEQGIDEGFDGVIDPKKVGAKADDRDTAKPERNFGTKSKYKLNRKSKALSKSGSRIQSFRGKHGVKPEPENHHDTAEVPSESDGLEQGEQHESDVSSPNSQDGNPNDSDQASFIPFVAVSVGDAGDEFNDGDVIFPKPVHVDSCQSNSGNAGSRSGDGSRPDATGGANSHGDDGQGGGSDNDEAPSEKKQGESSFFKASSHRKIETMTEIETTKSRQWWVRISKALTFYAPDFMLKYIGRMHRPDVRMAWREKVSICILIAFLWAGMLFLIVGIGLILCPKMHIYTADEVAQGNDISNALISMRGKVYDISTFVHQKHGKSVGGVPLREMMLFAGKEVNATFPIPIRAACPHLITKEDDPDFLMYLKVDPIEEMTLPFIHRPRILPNSRELAHDSFYFRYVVPKLKRMEKGDVVWDPRVIRNYHQEQGQYWRIINDEVFNLTPYFESRDALENENYPQWRYLDKNVEELFIENGERLTDVSKYWDALPISKRRRMLNYQCMKRLFYVGKVDVRHSLRCLFPNYLLLAAACLLMLVIFVKFLASLQFTRRRTPAEHQRFVVCLVPCYTEDEDSLMKTINALTRTTYSDSHKLLFIVCDGNIIGSGNETSTPQIVLDILGCDPKLDPPSYTYLAIGEGSYRHNMAKVYSGLYEHQGHIVPYIVVVKVGNESEVAKPGNRGKRDSQMLLLNFLSRVHFEAPMTELDLEIYHQLNDIIGISPRLHEFIMMVDADTQVEKESLSRLLAAMVKDSNVIGVCGETMLFNENNSWTTMIQVYEYFISHHMAKAFESLFGSVTCLPGCFSMYRIYSTKGAPLIISKKVIAEYAENHVDTLHKKNLLSLGEDRYLTTLMMKHFPKLKLTFASDALCQTTAPDKWQILLSQRRRWINSTIHNLFELLFLPNMCGSCCFSMRFVVFIDLFGTLTMPVVLVYLLYLVYLAVAQTSEVGYISLVLIGAVYGLQALIFILKRQWQHIGWMVIYFLAYPLWSFILPIYSFWHFDDFTWGNTRIVIGEDGKRQIYVSSDKEFDPSQVVMKTWADHVKEMYEKRWANRQNGIVGTQHVAPMPPLLDIDGSVNPCYTDIDPTTQWAGEGDANIYQQQGMLSPYNSHIPEMYHPHHHPVGLPSAPPTIHPKDSVSQRGNDSQSEFQSEVENMPSPRHYDNNANGSTNRPLSRHVAGVYTRSFESANHSGNRPGSRHSKNLSINNPLIPTAWPQSKIQLNYNNDSSHLSPALWQNNILSMPEHTDAMMYQGNGGSNLVAYPFTGGNNSSHNPSFASGGGRPGSASSSKFLSTQSIIERLGIKSRQQDSSSNVGSSRNDKSNNNDERDGRSASKKSGLVNTPNIMASNNTSVVNVDSAFSQRQHCELPSDSALKTEIMSILTVADLRTMTKKQVRLLLNQKFGVDLTEKRAWINQTIQDLLTQQQ